MEDPNISLEEIKKAIFDSGYLIEQRVEQVLTKKGYYVETNDVYLEHETAKTREIDLTAITAKEILLKENHWIFPYLLIECENNKQPIVFFRNTSQLDFLYSEEVKASGIPLKLYINQDMDFIGLNSFISLSDFHHYCKGVFSTQYCSFQQTNKSNIKKWMALHTDSQHDSLQNIIKCLKYKIHAHCNSYSLPIEDETEKSNIQLFYPLIILQGDMYEAYMEKGELKLKSQNHIQFRKQIVNNEKTESFQIDIIREPYLNKYLNIIEKETDEIVKRLKRKRKLLEFSINKIVESLKNEPDKNKHLEIMGV